MDSLHDSEASKHFEALKHEKNQRANKLQRERSQSKRDIMSEMYDRFSAAVESYGLSGIPEKWFYFDDNGKIPFHRDPQHPELERTFHDIEYDYKVATELAQKKSDARSRELDSLQNQLRIVSECPESYAKKPGE